MIRLPELRWALCDPMQGSYSSYCSWEQHEKEGWSGLACQVPHGLKPTVPWHETYVSGGITSMSGALGMGCMGGMERILGASLVAMRARSRVHCPHPASWLINPISKQYQTKAKEIKFRMVVPSNIIPLGPKHTLNPKRWRRGSPNELKHSFLVPPLDGNEVRCKRNSQK